VQERNERAFLENRLLRHNDPEPSPDALGKVIKPCVRLAARDGAVNVIKFFAAVGE
jgi:hypothetical protein